MNKPIANSNSFAIEQQKSSPFPDWDYPMLLAPTLSTDISYPIDSLPSLLQKTVSAYQRYGQQPTALVASGALANLSLCCQALGNVARDRYLTSPTSLYFLVVEVLAIGKPRLIPCSPMPHGNGKSSFEKKESRWCRRPPYCIAPGK